MNLEILAIYNELDEYLMEIKQRDADPEILWDKYAVEPYWDKISQGASFDISNRRPLPIRDIAKLEEQIILLKQINLEDLKKSLMKAVDALPNYNEKPMYVAIYPISDDDIMLKECMNGVCGNYTFGNMIINVNPLVENYLEWIPYIFAREYHHNIWGNYWTTLNGGLKGQFLESLIFDGEADSFALSLNPALKPQWIFNLSQEKEAVLWEEHYSKLIYSTEFNYMKYMFGDESSNIPWCAGYTMGYRIVDHYRKKNPHISFHELTEISPEEIMKKSGYIQYA